MGQTPINAAELAIPSDGIDAFLSLMARRSAESNGRFASDSVTKLVALPSADTVASLSEIIGSLVSSKPVMERLSGLVACGASAATADDVLAEFLSSATKLEELCLVNCTLENTVTALMEAVKNTEMKRLGLERSDLGIGSADSDCEGLTTSFCEALKVNKFLTSLNLSNTNLDTTFVVALIDALLESDTKLLPEDLGEDAEEVTGWSLEGRLDKAAFVSGGGRDDSNASLTDDETVGDDDDATPSPDASESDAGEDDAGDKDSGDEEADGDTEDEEGSEEEEEEEEAAHEAKARRLRERQEKEEWQARQERIRQELKALLQSEVRERSDLAHEYYQGLQDVVAINNAPIANLRATERQQKKEAYCSRRSGWSRLETLVLRGNQVGDRGCRSLLLCCETKFRCQRRRWCSARKRSMPYGAASGRGWAPPAVLSREGRRGRGGSCCGRHKKNHRISPSIAARAFPLRYRTWTRRMSMPRRRLRCCSRMWSGHLAAAVSMRAQRLTATVTPKLLVASTLRSKGNGRSGSRKRCRTCPSLSRRKA
ncbi:Leucine Rich repeat-containing protein [Leishmania donovani]|uniref:Leucine_Rich_repeat_putative/Pfam:PF13516 n=1 Tax=Leishmania donovani TaxID=5661 RepID=A0A6J8FIW0_LEIDO|nr:Leucine Rich repeat-containing protein [Leishmania donovani]VDZ47420.1 Leucine_Rich_repeat_putative/Pfam:PF13516 [Leishmania donovani]